MLEISSKGYYRKIGVKSKSVVVTAKVYYLKSILCLYNVNLMWIVMFSKGIQIMLIVYLGHVACHNNEFN